MDFRQDAAHRRWLEDAASRSSLCARRRAAEAGELGRGVRCCRRQGQSRFALQDRRDRRRSRDGRGNVRAEGAFRQARLAEHRLSPGRLQTASEIRPRVLSFQLDDRRRRSIGRDSCHRFEPAPRSAGAQRAHPQALAQGRRADRPHRAAGRPHLQIQLSRLRAGDARGGRGEAAGRDGEADVRHRRRRFCETRRRRRAGEPRQGRPGGRRRQRRVERLQRAARRGLSRGRARSRPGAGRGRARRASDGEGERARRAHQPRRGRDRH